ncbi:rhomboid-like protein [Amycolatopsis sp. cmx-11-12]|uniref:rhomboid-like protein n=1 Tax=Amycolatopsis sp. cmx-11-12 TaxID=2785795 RepID=UPI00391835DB
MLLSYLRRNPVTAGYLAFLLVSHLVLVRLLSLDRADSLLRWISTNLDNLDTHPVGALIGSILFFNGTLTEVWTLEFAGTVITLGLGVGWALAQLERRHGPLWTFSAFLAGHIGATLLTAPIIAYAIHHGWYPVSIRADLDYGISYGAQTALAMVTSGLSNRARPFWILFVLGWPLAGADFSGALPNFTTIGHLAAAGLGLMIEVATRIQTHDK